MAPLPIETNVQTTDDKAQIIQAAAFDAFLRFGFRRTSMADIARLAGMSRAALYLHYRNKEDIFRSLTMAYFETAETQVRAALAQPGSVAQQLGAGFAAQTGEVFRAVLNSPHGGELWDQKLTQAADVVQQGEARMVGVYQEWLSREAAAGRIDLSALGGTPEQVAGTILGALYGLKSPRPEFQAFQASARRLAVMLGRGLQADMGDASQDA